MAMRSHRVESEKESQDVQNDSHACHGDAEILVAFDVSGQIDGITADDHSDESRTDSCDGLDAESANDGDQSQDQGHGGEHERIALFLAGVSLIESPVAFFAEQCVRGVVETAFRTFHGHRYLQRVIIGYAGKR